MARMVERVSGVAGGLVGLLTLAYLLFGPASHYTKGVETCTNAPNSVSCTSTGLDHITTGIATGAIEIDLFPLSIFLMSVVALLFVALAVSAAQHSLSGDGLWQAGLWASTGLVVMLVLLTLYKLAPALAPALVLAVAASGAAWFAARQQMMGQDDRLRGVAQAMEVVCGVAAGLLGVAASAYLLTAPNQYVGESTTCDAQGVCHEVFSGSLSPLLTDPVGTVLGAVVSLGFFGLLAFSAVQHSRTRARVWRGWLWGISLLLVVFSILGMLSVGLFFLPSAVLALFAAVSTFGRARPVPELEHAA
jgi:hypothetical protein